MTKEIYISVDIETDGPCPGENNLLSLGAVAVKPGTGMISELLINFEFTPGASPSLKTEQEFWSRFPDQYAATRQNMQPVEQGVDQFCTWVKDLGGVPVAVAFPAGFDFSWIWYYVNRFGSGSPFSFSCIDMKTLAWCIQGGNYRHSTKRNWPSHWFDHGLPHTHDALADAREQAHTFLNMMQDLKRLHDAKHT